jgi:hypothetical protein
MIKRSWAIVSALTAQNLPRLGGGIVVNVSQCKWQNFNSAHPRRIYDLDEAYTSKM